jgi:hypothetical protein
MRKLILIAGFVLASAAAQAGEARSLTLASDAASVAAPAPAAPVAETPRMAEAPQAAEAPKYVERPALVETSSQPSKTEQPNVEPAKPVAEKTASAPKPEKPRHKRYWTESRIIGELHRHGIYW